MPKKPGDKDKSQSKLDTHVIDEGHVQAMINSFQPAPLAKPKGKPGGRPATAFSSSKPNEIPQTNAAKKRSIPTELAAWWNNLSKQQRFIVCMMLLLLVGTTGLIAGLTRSKDESSAQGNAPSFPGITEGPTAAPTLAPIATHVPTSKATTFKPTSTPTSTRATTVKPTTKAPSTKTTTVKPTTKAPTTKATTAAPSMLTKAPTSAATKGPTRQPTPQAVTAYPIVIKFMNNDISDDLKNVFVQAADKWSKTITKGASTGPYIPAQGQTCYGIAFESNTVIQAMQILVNVVAIDGVSGILGQAGPCVITTDGTKLFPRAGFMQLDIADLQNLLDRGLAYSVVLHEIGHILGIGTLWDSEHLIQDNTDGSLSFTGTTAKTASSLIGRPDGELPVVENTGGSGTARGHWKETVYHNELMTGYLGGKQAPMSILTIRSLKDIGYEVDESQAEAFNVNDAITALSAALKTAADKISYGNDIHPGKPTII